MHTHVCAFTTPSPHTLPLSRLDCRSLARSLAQSPGDSKALGSSQAQLLAPVQQLGSSYVAAVQAHGAAHGSLVCVPVAAAQQPKPLLDADQRLLLTAELHSLHVLHAPSSGSSSKDKVRSGSGGLAVVVAADGAVGAADFADVCLRPAANSNSSAAAAGGLPPAAAASGRDSHRRSSQPPVIAAASNGQLLAVAKQPPGSRDVALQVYSVIASTSSSSSMEVDGKQQQASKLELHLLHCCSLAGPSDSSRMASVSIAPGVVAVMWAEGAATVHHNTRLAPHGAAAQHHTAAHTATLQLPVAVPAAGAAVAAAADASASKRKRKAAASTHAAAGGQWSCVALSEQHLLLVQGVDASSMTFSLLDSRYGSCLSSGSLPAEAAAAAAASDGSRLALLPLPQHPIAPVALQAGSSVWLLPLQLPKADLAGLVSKLALNSRLALEAAAAAAATTATSAAAPTAAGAASKPAEAQLLTSKQQLNLAAIAAAVNGASNSSNGQQRRQDGPITLQQLPASQPASSKARLAGGAEAAVSAAVQRLWKALEQQPCVAAELSPACQQLVKALQQQQQELGRQPPQQRHHHPQQQQQLGEAASSCVQLSQQLLAQALSALADAEDWGLLQQVHELQPLQSLLGCPALVPALAAAEQYQLMRQVLLAAQEIPAEALVGAVAHLLQPQQDGPSAPQQAEAGRVRAAAEAMVAAAEAAAASGGPPAAAELLPAVRRAAASVDGFTSREVLLHLLLAAPVDAVEAQAALSALPAPAVLRLLRYLIKWLSKYSNQALAAPGTATLLQQEPLLVSPAAGQVLEWAKLLLDAHLTRLLMMPAAAPLLQQLQRLLRAEVGATSKLVALKGMAEHLAAGAPLPAAAEAANSEYTLELLDLRVTQLQQPNNPTNTTAGASQQQQGRRR
jgi:hypothetical protein